MTQLFKLICSFHALAELAWFILNKQSYYSYVVDFSLFCLTGQHNCFVYAGNKRESPGHAWRP